MDKLNDFFKNLFDRFSNPLIFSFILSWLAFNWDITVSLFWYDPDLIESSGSKSLFDFIDQQLNRNGSFYVPLIIAILYTFLMPPVKNVIIAFNTWMQKLSDSWNLKILKGGKISIEKYLSLRSNYIAKTNELEDVIAGDSDHIQKYQEASTELTQLRKSYNDIVMKEDTARDVIGNFFNTTVLNGSWQLKYKDTSRGISGIEDIIIEGSQYFIQEEYGKKRHAFNIIHFSYDKRYGTMYFVKEVQDQAELMAGNRLKYNITSLKMDGNDKLIGKENGTSDVQYIRRV